jgi:polyisoprenyl-teichoic acid--peptidoglycan teichoic acid transferase
MTKPFVRLLSIILLLSLASCTPPLATERPTPKAVAQLFITAGPDSTATPTPFQPVGPTITFTPTATLSPTNTPLPTATAVPTIPTPFLITQKLPEGVVNILLLGSDARPGGGYRTDVIQLVSINTGKGTVGVVSFPRDLYLTIPGWGINRINTAQAHGFPTMASTFEYNFGVRPTYYVMTNFEGFKGIINGLDGIDVKVGQALTDKCDLPQAVGTNCTVKPGIVKMDGATALWYVRSRHSTSDFDRGRRTQEVLYGIFAKLMTINAITRLPQVYADYKDGFETNMGFDTIASLLPVAPMIMSDPSRIHRYTISPHEAYPYIAFGGAMVLQPNYPAIQAIINQSINGQ